MVATRCVVNVPAIVDHSHFGSFVEKFSFSTKDLCIIDALAPLSDKILIIFGLRNRIDLC